MDNKLYDYFLGECLAECESYEEQYSFCQDYEKDGVNLRFEGIVYCDDLQEDETGAVEYAHRRVDIIEVCFYDDEGDDIYEEDSKKLWDELDKYDHTEYGRYGNRY